MLLNCVLEKTLDSPLDCKEIKPVHPKGDQSWVFIQRTDAEAETPILWPPHAKSWLIGKDPDSGRDWGQEEKGMTEDELAGWHYRLGAHEFVWTARVGDGQGGLVCCCDSWGRGESDTTEWLNWTELNWILWTSSPDKVKKVKRKVTRLGEDTWIHATNTVNRPLSNHSKKDHQSNRGNKKGARYLNGLLKEDIQIVNKNSTVIQHVIGSYRFRFQWDKTEHTQ